MKRLFFNITIREVIGIAVYNLHHFLPDVVCNWSPTNYQFFGNFN
jgi:hypothetical protein